MYTIGVDHNFGKLQTAFGNSPRIYGYRILATSLYDGEYVLHSDVGPANQNHLSV